MSADSLASLSLGLSIATLVMLVLNWMTWLLGERNRPRHRCPNASDDMELVVLVPESDDEEDPADSWKRGRGKDG